MTYVHTDEILITIKIMNIASPPRSSFRTLCNLSFLISSIWGNRTDLLSVTIDHFAFSRVLYKWNHIILFVFLQHNYFKILPCVMCTITSVFFIAQEYSIIWLYHDLNHSPVNGPLSGFQFSVITNRTAMNICVQIFAWSGWIIWQVCMLLFKKLTLLFKLVIPFYILTSSV